MTWGLLSRSEPRLAELEMTVHAINAKAPESSYCANRGWYDAHKPIMLALVSTKRGFPPFRRASDHTNPPKLKVIGAAEFLASEHEAPVSAENNWAELRSDVAYDVAYNRLYEQLPRLPMPVIGANGHARLRSVPGSSPT